MPMECLGCNQPLPAKYLVWQVVACHFDGCTTNAIVQATGLPSRIVQKELDELYVNNNVYPKRRKWYPEMAVSLGYHSH